MDGTTDQRGISRTSWGDRLMQWGTAGAGRESAAGRPELCNRLQKLLESRQLSVYDVAARAGMQPKQVHRIVSGVTRNPGILTVQRIVEAAGGSLPDILRESLPGGASR